MFYKKYKKYLIIIIIISSYYYYNMNRNVKYKQVCRLSLCGSDDLLKFSAASTYSCNNNGITNSKRMRFPLNNSLNDVNLSQNAKCILESCFVPNAPFIGGNVIHVRLVASSETKTYDTTKNLNGNPVILTLQSGIVVYNNNDMFNSFHVSSNFLTKGFIEIELEAPTAVQNIGFFTGSILTLFFITLIIIDEDVELTKDLTLAPPIDYNNYNVNIPIRNY